MECTGQFSELSSTLESQSVFSVMTHVQTKSHPNANNSLPATSIKPETLPSAKTNISDEKKVDIYCKQQVLARIWLKRGILIHCC